jgi:hypothetical protein
VTKGKRGFFLGLAVGALVGQIVGVMAYRLSIDLYTFGIWAALILFAGTYYFEDWINDKA